MSEEEGNAPVEEGVTTTTEIKKRAVAVNKKIGKINKETDLRVAVIGSIVELDTKSMVFTIDDGADKLNVILNNEEQIKKLKVGQIARVIGVVMGFESGFELRGEIVQNFTGLNVEYYNKYLSMIDPS